MPSIGPLELIIVLVIAIVVLGPKRLPDLGRSLGLGMREFKDAISGGSKAGERSAIDTAPAHRDDASVRSRD